MDQASREALRLVQDDPDSWQEDVPDLWQEAQRVIEQAQGLRDAIIERQLEELDDSVVGTSADELARLRDEATTPRDPR